MPTSKGRRGAPRKQHRADRMRKMRRVEERLALVDSTGLPPRGIMVPELVMSAGQGLDGPCKFRADHDIDTAAYGELLQVITLNAEKFDFGVLPFMPNLQGGYNMPVPNDDVFAAWGSGALRLPSETCWFEYMLPGMPEKRYGLLIVEKDPQSWELTVFELDRTDNEFYTDGLTKHITNRANLSSADQDIEFILTGNNPQSRDKYMADSVKVKCFLSDLRVSIFLATMLPDLKREKIVVEGPSDIFNHWRIDFHRGASRTSGHTPESLAALKWRDLPSMEPLDADMFREMMADSREKFQARFGRDPKGDDPLFFDPEADTPQHMTSQNIRGGFLDAMGKAGLPPHLAYAYAKTGLVISQSNRHLHTPDQLRAWEMAMDEFDALSTTEH